MDIARFLDKPAAIVGTTGAGKTFTAKGAVELLLALGRRVVVIDPTGAWYGLRAGADGEAPGGFPVLIFGGEHADIPIAPDGGERVAEALAGRDVQAIIDTSEMTGGEKTRFLTDFLQKLYALNKAALHLVVDEADEVCPQNPMPEERRLSGAFDKIVRRGRIKGFRPLMITQRPAVLHKNVLSQIGTLIALKLTSPQDRKAIEDWVKGNADADQARAVMSSLPTLKRGEGWVWSPADSVLERVTFPPIRTFDSSRTPDADEAVVEPALTAVDVEALREAMKVADAAPDTPAAAHGASKAEIEAAEKRGHKRGYAEGHTAGEAEMYARIRRIVISVFDNEIVTPTAGSPSGKATGFDPVTADSNPAPATKPRPAKAFGSDPLVEAARQVWPAKMTWGGLAAMCGRKARGGHFNSTRKRLIDGGVVREEGGLVVLADPPSIPAGIIPADLLEQNLPQPAAKMFAAIRQRPGVTPIGLASVLGMQPRGGHWNNGMAILRRNDLITESDGLRIAAGLEGV